MGRNLIHNLMEKLDLVLMAAQTAAMSGRELLQLADQHQFILLPSLLTMAQMKQGPGLGLNPNPKFVRTDVKIILCQSCQNLIDPLRRIR